jgi:simple sugar transport system permease protein
MKIRLSTNAAVTICRVIPLIIVLAIAFGLISIVLDISGFNPLDVLVGLFNGGFGSLSRFGQTLDQATPLILCSSGLILAFKCGIWNIGAEGQLYIGAIGGLIGGYFVPSITQPLQILLMAMLAFIFGGLWAAIPAYFKTRFNTNEVIVTLLMVFIAQWLVSYLVRFPWRSSTAVGYPVSETIWETSWLPQLPGIEGHAGIIIALVLAVVLWFLLKKSVYGYRIKAIGANRDAALYGGIPVNKIIMSSMILSGGLAGLAGMIQVSGIYHVLAEHISVSYGFLAIVVAYVGKLHPIGAAIMAIFLGGLLSGSYYIQPTLGLDVSVVQLLIAFIMLALVLLPYIEKRFNNLLSIDRI